MKYLEVPVEGTWILHSRTHMEFALASMGFSQRQMNTAQPDAYGVCTRIYRFQSLNVWSLHCSSFAVTTWGLHCSSFAVTAWAENKGGFCSSFSALCIDATLYSRTDDSPLDQVPPMAIETARCYYLGTLGLMYRLLELFPLPSTHHRSANKPQIRILQNYLRSSSPVF